MDRTLTARGGDSSPLGRHLLADLQGVAAHLLCSGALLDSLLRRAARAGGAHILGSHFHSFGASDGITGVLLLAESHMSIHTWPEAGFAAVDIFMCGTADPLRALSVLLDELAPAKHRVQTLPRGTFECREHDGAAAA